MRPLLLCGLLVWCLTAGSATPDSAVLPTIQQDPTIDLTLPAPEPVAAPAPASAKAVRATKPVKPGRHRSFFANLLQGGGALLLVLVLGWGYRRLRRR